MSQSRAKKQVSNICNTMFCNIENLNIVEEKVEGMACWLHI